MLSKPGTCTEKGGFTQIPYLHISSNSIALKVLSLSSFKASERVQTDFPWGTGPSQTGISRTMWDLMEHRGNISSPQGWWQLCHHPEQDWDWPWLSPAGLCSPETENWQVAIWLRALAWAEQEPGQLEQSQQEGAADGYWSCLENTLSSQRPPWDHDRWFVILRQMDTGFGNGLWLPDNPATWQETCVQELVGGEKLILQGIRMQHQVTNWPFCSMEQNIFPCYFF